MSSLPNDHASQQEAEGGDRSTRSKQVEPSSPRSPPRRRSVRSFIRSISFPSTISFHKLFFPPFILGNFGRTRPGTTHNNIFFSSATVPSSPLPSFPRPSIPSPHSVPSIVVTCNKWLDSPPHSLTRWKSASHPDSHRRPPPLLRRKGAKVSLHRRPLANVDGITENFFTKHPPIHSTPLALSHSVRIAAHKCIHQVRRERSFVRSFLPSFVWAISERLLSPPQPQSRTLECRVMQSGARARAVHN